VTDVEGRRDAARLTDIFRSRNRESVELVSVIIPVYNNWPVTYRCLESLASCDHHIAIQIIVVDDGSSDETMYQLPRISGIDVVRNGRNLGFVGACNRGAAIARGRYSWFLNNDTTLCDGALAALVARIDSDTSIGVVGSKLVYPDGTLQEAGGIIFDDGMGWNYGRASSPARSEYNFVRDVDYVSGASLLVRTELFLAIGGFDERYAPAYYEDADLCFAAREFGFRVVYEPRSVVVHYEGVTSGTDIATGTKRYQEINRPKFVQKWHETLGRDHFPSSSDNVMRASNRREFERTILVIDSYVPAHDKEAGSNRLFHLISGFVRAGQRVIFFPDNFAGEQPYCGQLEAMGVEVLYATPGDERTAQDQLLRILPLVDVAWICRPDLCGKYLLFVRRHSSAKIIYDTIDLHFVRLRREAEFLEDADDKLWRSMERLELAAAGAADGTVVVNEIERQTLQSSGIENIAVVSTVHDVAVAGPRVFADTSGVLFIGGYNHVPNVDAVKWLIECIMPLVWERAPYVHVTLLGSNPSAQVCALANDRVSVTGYLEDVEQYFLGSRVFVAPLRFGAGIKGKIGHSLSYGLPTVTTPVGAEGFGLTDGIDCRIATGESNFARAILDLYHDEDEWKVISANAVKALESFSSRRVCADAMKFVGSIASSSGTPPPRPEQSRWDLRTVAIGATT
jgi:GT2 family glycosyltransferase/glycosyltransferase involved in cell wall biosynthesis